MQLRLKNAERKIEEVHGGRIVRPTGRKDRHSKVCTPKGLRDRRVRLSAHAAIQFYDVQDQLGFDRPSKVIDWLMEKAKKAIDELEKVPNNGAQQTEQDPEEEQNPDDHLQHQQQYNDLQDLNENPINNLSFFSPSSSINLLNHPPDLNSRAVGRTQDLFLNLHNSSSKNIGEIIFDPTFNDWSRLETPEMNQLQIISETGNGGEGFGFNSAPEMGQFQKMIAWNSESGNGEEEFCFNYLPLCQNQLLSQREPLQSSNSPSSNYALNKLPISTNAHHQNPAFNPCVGFTSNGFSRFRIPAQIHGEDEMQNAVSNKPS